ncbi:hypothetical protein EDB80DRAFT_553479, partial [Ilyonectria destructans]
PAYNERGRKNKCRSPKAWGHQGSDWANRAGFTANFGFHAARREALINANDRGYSLGQVLRFASQRSAGVLFNSYLGDMSTVDGSASYLKLNLRHNLADDFRSASMKRNPNLRFSLTPRERRELEVSPEYAPCTNQIELLQTQIDHSPPGDDVSQLEDQRKSLYNSRRTLERKTLKKCQQSQKVIYDTDCEEHEQDDWRRSHFRRIYHMLPKERQRLAEIMTKQVLPRSPEWISALNDLISLRLSNHRVAYQ